MAIEKTFKNTRAGTVKVKYAIFDIDGTNLEEGIRISGDEIYDDIIIYGWTDVMGMTKDKINEILKDTGN